MNRRLICNKIAILLIGLTLAVPLCHAQGAPSAPVNTQNGEVMGENDQLPFMHTEQAAEPQEPTSGGLLLKTLGSMLLIVGLIFFGAWGAKKLGIGNVTAGSGEQDLAVLSSVSLGNGRTISMVRFCERVLLVGSTPQSMTLLAEDAGNSAPSFTNSRSVAELLAEEQGLFDDKLQQAEARLSDWDARGGTLS